MFGHVAVRAERDGNLIGNQQLEKIWGGEEILVFMVSPAGVDFHCNSGFHNEGENWLYVMEKPLSGDFAAPANDIKVGQNIAKATFHELTNGRKVARVHGVPVPGGEVPNSHKLFCRGVWQVVNTAVNIIKGVVADKGFCFIKSFGNPVRFNTDFEEGHSIFAVVLLFEVQQGLNVIMKF